MPTFEVDSGGKSYEIEAPDINAATAALGKMNAAPTPEASTTADVAKSGGIGLAKGAIGLAGLPGDAVAGIDKLSAWLAGKLGEDPAKTAADQAKLRASPFTLPTSGDIQGKVEGVSGKFYEPQTTAGKYAQTVGEFAPAALGGPGGLVSRGIRQAVIPGVASEAAGQATAGTAAEPYARIGAGLAGGLAGSLRRAPAAAEAPTLDALQTARTADYTAAHDLGISITPAALQREAGAIRADLLNDGLSGRVAPRTTAALDELSNRIGPAALSDVDNVRKELGVIAQGSRSLSPIERSDAAAATRAIAHIDDMLPRLAANPADLASGHANASRAVQFLENARGNAAAGFRAQALDRAEYRADLNSAAANSGANYENALRQQVKQILARGAPGFNAQERAAMESLVRGEGARNVIRSVGNLLGGGGGLGAVVAGGVGHMALPGLGAAAPAVGYGLKRAGNAATERAFNRLDEMVRARSPLGQAMPQPVAPARTDPRLAALLAAIQARPQVDQQQQTGGLLDALRSY